MLVSLLWFGAIVSRATPYYVATNGPGGAATEWGNAKSNIQDAISLCSSGDVVWVSNGVYQTGGITNWPSGGVLTNRVAITTQYVTVRSANNDPANTIIKGAWNPNTTNGPVAVRCVYMTNNTTLIGFTITNGATVTLNETIADADLVGGGIYFKGIISNCVIAGNSSYGSGSTEGGGGANGGTCFNCTLIGNSTRLRGGGANGVVLSNCTVACNRANGGGGGVYASTLYNCLVISNTSPGNAGGTYYSSLYNCTVAYNVASGAGAGAMYPTLARNCLVYGNQGAGVSLGNGHKVESCTIVGNSYGLNQTSGGPQTNIILNCIIYSNETYNWTPYANSAFMFTNTCITPTNIALADFLAAGNTTNNPILINFGSGYGTNHVAGNYRLSPNSPCVNSGLYQSWMTNAVDMDGRVRIRYGTVDMGAYERINSGAIFGFH